MKDEYSIAWFIVGCITLIAVGEQVLEYYEKKLERNRRKNWRNNVRGIK